MWKTSINKIFLIFLRSALAAGPRDQMRTFSSGCLLAGISLTSLVQRLVATKWDRKWLFAFSSPVDLAGGRRTSHRCVLPSLPL